MVQLRFIVFHFNTRSARVGFKGGDITTSVFIAAISAFVLGGGAVPAPAPCRSPRLPFGSPDEGSLTKVGYKPEDERYAKKRRECNLLGTWVAVDDRVVPEFTYRLSWDGC